MSVGLIESGDTPPDDSQFDVSSGLRSLSFGRDVIVKAKGSLPTVFRGEDVDVLTRAPQEFVRDLVSSLGTSGWEAQIVNRTLGHFQVKVSDQKGLCFMFDIWPLQNPWANLKLKPSFFDSLLATSQARKLSDELAIPVPDNLYEALFRYAEYCQYFWVGRDKAHHLAWIEKNLTVEQQDLLFELAHYYLEPDSLRAPEKRATSENGLRMHLYVGPYLRKALRIWKRLWRILVRRAVRLRKPARRNAS